MTTPNAFQNIEKLCGSQEYKMIQALWKTLAKLNIQLPYNLASVILDIKPR